MRYITGSGGVLEGISALVNEGAPEGQGGAAAAAGGAK